MAQGRKDGAPAQGWRRHAHQSKTPRAPGRPSSFLSGACWLLVHFLSAVSSFFHLSLWDTVHWGCCCCCQVTSVVSDSVRPHRRQPTRLPDPWDSPGKNTGVAISFSNAWKWSRSVVSNSQRPHGLEPTRLLRPWDFPGKSTGVGCHCLLLTGASSLQSSFLDPSCQVVHHFTGWREEEGGSAFLLPAPVCITPAAKDHWAPASSFPWRRDLTLITPSYQQD